MKKILVFFSLIAIATIASAFVITPKDRTSADVKVEILTLMDNSETTFTPYNDGVKYNLTPVKGEFTELMNEFVDLSIREHDALHGPEITMVPEIFVCYICYCPNCGFENYLSCQFLPPLFGCYGGVHNPWRCPNCGSSEYQMMTTDCELCPE